MSTNKETRMASEYRFPREARDRFLSGEPGTYPGLRVEILESWQRSANSGVRPEQFKVPYQPDLDTDGVLQRAARPVLDHVAEDLLETGIGLLLTNERAEILDRRAADHSVLAQLDRVLLTVGHRYAEEDVGTNAIGTALTLHRPSIVLGGEHFADALGPLACVAVAFDDPCTGRFLGVLDVTCEVDDASALMFPFVRRVAREVEQRLLDAAIVGERTLREHFLQAKRWAKVPIVSLSKDSMMTNRAAADILHPSDQALLWEWIQRELTDDHQGSEFILTNGTAVTASFEPVTDGAEFVGAIIRLNAARSPNLIVNQERPVTNRKRPMFGWASMTDTERRVAELVAHGLSNREAASRLFLSRHTVDYHLRSIFRKIGVDSRVQLATLVLERAMSPS